MIQEIGNIYKHLGDDTSKDIFEKRLMFSLTGDIRYIVDIVRSTALYREVRDILLRDKHRKYIVGAGQWGKIMTDLFLEFGIEGILDNYVSGTYNGLPILPMKEFLRSTPEASVYIASTTFHRELCEIMEEIGVTTERIVDVAGMMLRVYHEQQYFDLPYLEQHRKEHEVFIDGGCYDGANSLRFVQWAGDAEKTIYAFEADGKNAKTCLNVLGQIEGADCHLIQKGIWSREATLNFCAKENEASSFMENGQMRIPVTSLDDAVHESVTFIKMDIEGAEYEALKGAEKMISRDRPKLAISIYHKAEDIWELPQLILSYHPEYTFFLRHYSLASEETVLYAVP